MNLLGGFGKHRVGEGPKVERRHSWDSTFASLKANSMKKREKQLQGNRGGYGVKDRQQNYDKLEKQKAPTPSRRLVILSQKDIEERSVEEVMPPPLPKEIQQQLFMQKLFIISKQHLDEIPPERRMSFVSDRTPQGTLLSSRELDPPSRHPSLLTAIQASHQSGLEKTALYPPKPVNVKEVSNKEKEQAWTVETVVTSLTSSCTVFDTLCTNSFPITTFSRPQQKRRSGPIPPIPSSKRRPFDPVEQPIPIPMTISFTKSRPPPGWEDLSLDRHFAELERNGAHTNAADNYGEDYDDTSPVMEDRQLDDEIDHASSSGFVSLTSSIPTRRSHGLWSTTQLH